MITVEKNPKKKRLLKERQFKERASKAVLSKMFDGSEPQFEKGAYDS